MQLCTRKIIYLYLIFFHAQGRTPLRIALLEGSLDIAGLLLDNAADIDYVDTDCRFHSRFHEVSFVSRK